MLKKLNQKKNQKGFTLVELLIVIAIIGILAAIAIPQFSSYRQKAYMAVTKSDVKNAYTAVQAYISENPGQTLTVEPVTGPGAFGTPLGSARVSKDVTVSIASDGAVTGTHAGVTGYSYLLSADGAPTESGIPQ
jgi:type IV pilus assembly protein PilA